MSRTKLVLEVVQGLRSLADSLEELANAVVGDGDGIPHIELVIKANDAYGAVSGEVSVAAPVELNVAPAVPPNLSLHTDNPTPALTIVDLRAYVAERSTPENRSKIKDILTRFGVKKLTELPETQYEALMREVAAL